MKMHKKIDLSYLFTWITTVISSSLLMSLLINPLRTVSGFFCVTVKNRYLFVYIVISVITSVILMVNIYRFSVQSIRISVLTVITNQVLGLGIHVALFALFRASIVVDPAVIILTQYLKLYTTDSIIVEAPLSQLLFLCLLQSVIYMTVSILSYYTAKILQNSFTKPRKIS